MGQVLLSNLGVVMAEPTSGLWRFRRVILDEGRLQLAFAATAHHDETRQMGFQQWAMLRHHEFTNSGVTSERGGQQTIAILLTPRYDGSRYWDMTAFFIAGDLDLDAEEVDRFRRPWSKPEVVPS